MGGTFHRLSLWNFKTSATFYDTAYEIWPYRRMCSFHLHSMVKIRLFANQCPHIHGLESKQMKGRISTAAPRILAYPLQSHARINYSRKNYKRPDTWANTYQYLWRWGSYFIPRSEEHTSELQSR